MNITSVTAHFLTCPVRQPCRHTYPMNTTTICHKMRITEAICSACRRTYTVLHIICMYMQVIPPPIVPGGSKVMLKGESLGMTLTYTHQQYTISTECFTHIFQHTTAAHHTAAYHSSPPHCCTPQQPTTLLHSTAAHHTAAHHSSPPHCCMAACDAQTRTQVPCE